MRPFQRVIPGEAISATEYNRQAAEVERHSRWTVAAPLTLVSDANGQRLSVSSRPSMWVRLTGHKLAAGYNSETGTDEGDDLTKYSGFEQTDDNSTAGSYDLDGGIEFYVDQIYLKEVNGRVDVPDGAIVRANQSENGPYYTFQFEQAFEDYSTGLGGNELKVTQCVGGVVRTMTLTATDATGRPITFTLSPAS